MDGSTRCLILHLTPCFLISKMEPTLEDTSPGVCGGLRRHPAQSAEKHLCRDQENRVLCHQGKLGGAREEESGAQEGSGGEGGGMGRGDLERDPDQTRRVQGCACSVLRRPALPDGQPTQGALPPPSPPPHRTGSARTHSQGTHGWVPNRSLPRTAREGGACPRGRVPRPSPRGFPTPEGWAPSVRSGETECPERPEKPGRRGDARSPGPRSAGRGAARPGRAPPQARAPPASSAGGARRELGHCGRRGRARRGVRGKCGGGTRGRREVGVPAGAGPVRPAAGSAPAARRSGSHGLSPAAPSTGPHRGGRGARGRRRGPFKGTARRPRARTRRPGARRPAARWAPWEGRGRRDPRPEGPGRGRPLHDPSVRPLRKLLACDSAPGTEPGPDAGRAGAPTHTLSRCGAPGPGAAPPRGGRACTGQPPGCWAKWGRRRERVRGLGCTDAPEARKRGRGSALGRTARRGASCADPGNCELRRRGGVCFQARSDLGALAVSDCRPPVAPGLLEVTLLWTDVRF